MYGIDPITFGDIESNLTGFVVLTGFGVFFSCIVYCLMVYPSMRREEYRTYKGFSKHSGMVVGFAIFLVFAAGGYYSYLRSFFQINLENSQINLLYRVPKRIVTLDPRDIDRIVRHIEPTKSGARVSLRIFTRSGQVYESAQIKPRDFDVRFKKLETWLIARRMGRGREAETHHFRQSK